MTAPLAQCEHPTNCPEPDTDPKFHVLAPVATTDGRVLLGWGGTYHHDCAAELGYEKAQVIVDATGGAKGEELRALLTDPNHPVHAAVAAHSEQEFADAAAAHAAVQVGE